MELCEVRKTPDGPDSSETQILHKMSNIKLIEINSHAGLLKAKKRKKRMKNSVTLL